MQQSHDHRETILEESLTVQVPIFFDPSHSIERLYDTPPPSKLIEQFKSAALLTNIILPENFQISCPPESTIFLESLMEQILIHANHGSNREELEKIVLKFYFSLTHKIPKQTRRARIRELFRQIFCLN